MKSPDPPPDNAPENVLMLYRAAKEAHGNAIAIKAEFDQASRTAKEYNMEYERAVRELLQTRLF